ncbi:hypothetical protein CK203_047621 [Vitis vinifera]|uniref:Reverse transcriptase domain-containing protein n=1 Tax=Vitis vinifera TaxID=29760 RepID=A0A438H5Z2_VITVI|nr:hypothetical protein CK203_047621 [Vitis vinifera]
MKALRRFLKVIDELALRDLLLQGDGGRMRRDPIPFRFENMWLKEGFKDLLKGWWQGAFQHLLSDSDDWCPSLDGLVFKRLVGEEAARLEEAFSDEEVVFTLFDLSGNKASGSNGYSLAFWQSSWEFVKEEGGVEDLRDFRPISLVGGLCKLLAKVLANKLKKVVGKVVSSSQNAFVERRQILDVVLIANEAIDSLLKSNECGVLCKLDLEKAYDHLKWDFLLQVAGLKGGVGSLWMPPHKLAAWDGVEERFRRRLAMWKRQYISKGGRLTLIQSTLSSMPIYYMSILHKSKGGLGVGCLSTLNRALLGKWSWRLMVEREALWKQDISRKRVRFWKDSWCGAEAFCNSFPSLFALAVLKEEWVLEVWDPSVEGGSWGSRFSRAFNDWEVVLVERLLMTIQGKRVSTKWEDRVVWNKTKSGIFLVKSLYSAVESGNTVWFPSNIIWSPYVPPKVVFFFCLGSLVGESFNIGSA